MVPPPVASSGQSIGMVKVTAVMLRAPSAGMTDALSFLLTVTVVPLSACFLLSQISLISMVWLMTSPGVRFPQVNGCLHTDCNDVAVVNQLVR